MPGYDCIHDEQVKWYEDVVKFTKENNGGTNVHSVAFFHIPFPEFETAWELSKAGSSEVEVIIPQTDKSEYEGVAAPKINTKLFDKMVELGSTNAVFCAHDHKNNYAIKYKGITLSYGVNSTDMVLLVVIAINIDSLLNYTDVWQLIIFRKIETI